MGVLAVTVVAMVAVAGYLSGTEWAYFAAGAGVVSLCWVFDFAATSVQIQRLVDGAQAERFTATEIRRLRSKGWRGVDHVEFHQCDVDHVVAGPGGVLAVETKWTNEPWDIEDGEFKNKYAIQAVGQCARGAQKIHWLLRDRANLRIEVVPLLVIWGPGRPAMDEPVRIGGVLVVAGPMLRDVLTGMPEGLEKSQRDDIVRAMESFVEMRDEHDKVRGRAGPATGPVAA
jgi:hypothetical protein